MDSREDQIRARAHALWEAEGRPQGRDRLHWDQAALELAGPSGVDDKDEAAIAAESAIEVMAPTKAKAKPRRSRKPAG